MATRKTSKSTLKRLQAWQTTRLGHAIFMVVELGLAYALASRALDTGSWWEYSFAALCLVGALRNLVRLFNRK